MISTAIFEDVKKAFPEASVDLQTSRSYKQLFTEDRRFNDVMSVDMKGDDRGARGLWRLLAKVREQRYDLVIDLQSNDRSRWFLSLLRILSSGRTAMVGLHDYFPYHHAPEKNAPAGFVRQQLALQAAGITASTAQPTLYVPQRNRERVQDLVKQYSLPESGFVIFLPGSHPSGKLKRWGAHRYAALADTLYGQGIGPAVLVGGPDDQEECSGIVEKVDKAESVVNLCCKTEIMDIIPLAERAGFTVGSDTGPAHVASAAGSPMLIICGPTDPRRVKPAGDHVDAIQADIDCINCYKKECSHHSCMAAITVEMVLNKIETGMAPPE